jgi:hypothetical protein
MANARGPYYIIINSHSAFAPHSALIQTNTWTNAVSSGGQGQFLNHLGVGVDAVDMVEALVDVLVPFYPTDYVFDNWTVYHQPADPGPSYPQAGSFFTSKVGTDATPGWSKATMATLWWKTVTFGDFKLVLLDFGSNDDFNKTSTLTAGRMLNLHLVVVDDSWGWCGRDNQRPATFKSSTVKLSDELRKVYRMA